MVTCLIEDTCPMTSHLPKNVHQDVPDQFIKVSNNIIEFASFYDQKTFFVQFWTTPFVTFQKNKKTKFLVIHSVLGWSRRCRMIQATSRSTVLLGFKCIFHSFSPEKLSHANLEIIYVIISPKQENEESSLWY